MKDKPTTIVRDIESMYIARERSGHVQEFALAEHILDSASAILTGRSIANPEGDALLGRVVIGHLIKIIQVFWSIVVLTERALPASSLVRELAETVISLAYLLKENSVERAWLYRDHITVRDLRDLEVRQRDPDLKDLAPAENRRIREQVENLISRRGADEFEKLRNWKTWGGPFSLEEMAKRVNLAGTVYNTLYRFESRAPHALDIAEYVTVTSEGNLIPTLPATAERHLMPSALLLVTAFDLGARALKLGHEDELAVLRDEVVRISGADENGMSP